MLRAHLIVAGPRSKRLDRLGFAGGRGIYLQELEDAGT